ncbi:hypothetical protein HPB50_015232 [Hyalomma asiaticum]|uniref:Uncharacterized protein n=1 Tax=Hyalomma asiaticum TaxID=266040 RepID=A0ACB7SM77_HYAAI|nr:hypothetical protein HPB50_015232 [Hyalomma asiaticum]
MKNYFRAHRDMPEFFSNLTPANIPYKSVCTEHNLIMVSKERDRLGRSVGLLRIGAWNPSVCSLNDLTRCLIVITESHLTVEETQIGGFVSVFDMEGLGLHHLAHLTPRYFMKILHVLQDCLPLRTEKIYVVNNPSIFALLFAAAKPFLHRKLLSKIELLGYDFHKLQALVPADVISKKHGGTLEDFDYGSCGRLARVMNAEAATPEASSEVEKSGESTKVRRSKGLSSLLSQLSPKARRLSLYKKPGTEDLCRDTDELKLPAAPPSSPAPAVQDSRVSAKKTGAEQHPTSRIHKMQAEAKSNASKLNTASIRSPTKRQRSDLLSRRVVPPKVRSSSQTESSSLPVRKCGDETTGDLSYGGQSEEAVIDSLPRIQGAAAKYHFGTETPLGHVNTGRVTYVPAVLPNYVVDMPVSRMITGVKALFSGCGSESSDGALLFYVLILPCVGAVLLGTLLLFLALMHAARFRSFTGTPRSPSIESDSRVVCYTSVCREVVALLAQTADRAVQPCDDFYRHVCGNWESSVIGVTPSYDDREAGTCRPCSYAEANVRAFVARVHRNLEYLTQDPSRCTPRDCRMARFYESCMQFATDQGQKKHYPSVLEVFERAGVDLEAWKRASSLPELLRLVVTTSLRTGLVSSPSVRLSVNGDVFVDVGESLRHVLEPHGREGALIERFLGDSLAVLREDVRNVSQGAVLAVDASVEGIRKTLDLSVHLFRIIRQRDLPPPLNGFIWSLQMEETKMSDDRALSAGFTRRKDILWARAVEKIGAVIELFGAVDLEVAGIYLLLLTASHVVKYAYLLHTFEVQDRLNAMQVCLKATAEYFPGQFPFWLADTTQTPEARFYLDEMVAKLRQSATDMFYDTKALAINGSEFTRTPVTSIGPRRSVQDSKVPSLSEGFPLCIIQLSSEPLVQDWLMETMAAQQQLRGDITSTEVSIRREHHDRALAVPHGRHDALGRLGGNA